MALDWNKEISFSGLKRPNRMKSSAKTSYPEKRYMNLMVRDSRQTEPGKVAALAVALVLIVALFAKFGVFDFYDRVSQKQAELGKQQQVLNALEAQLANYDDVEEEFEAYASALLSADAGTVSAMEALDLVDRMIAPNAHVKNINLANNTLTLNLSNITLDNVGKLVSALYDQPMVASVSVSTAATQETAAADVTATMTIMLQRA